MNIELTTNHPTSHYGIPTLLINGQAFGPSDRIGSGTAAQLAVNLAGVGELDREQAAAFCRQWPEGPQIEG